MQPLAIIEYLNELENLGAGFVPRAVPSVMDQFILQGAKEALDRRIVIAIAFATHTAHQPMLSQQALVGEELAQSFMPLQFILELAAMFFVLGAASWLFARVSWRIDLTEIP